MRAIFGFLSVLLALWLVGSLVKSQLVALKPAPAALPDQTTGGQTPQQVQQQFKESLERAMRQHASPDVGNVPGAAAGDKP